MYFTKLSVFVLFLVHLKIATCQLNNTIPDSNQNQSSSTVDEYLLECLRNPTIPCVRRNGFKLLNKLFSIGEFKFSDHIFLKKNTNADKNVSLSFEKQLFTKQFETKSFRDRLEKFLVSHELAIRMPDMLFNGATVKIAPTALQNTSVVAKIEFEPNENATARSDNGTPRIFFKKIKKFLKNKLLIAAIAIILIIKIIKIKIMWILPLLIGATATKKFILKILLFMFPALANLFKLCGFYQANFHKTNYHHHKHHINHLHTILYDNPDLKGHVSPHYVPNLIKSRPPKGHPSEYLHGNSVPAHLSYQPQDWELSGPGLGPEYISDISRHETFNPKYVEDVKELNSWGLGYNPPISQDHYNSRQFPNYLRLKSKAGYVPGPGGPQKGVLNVGAASNVNQQYVQYPLDENLLHAQKQEEQRIAHEKRLIYKQQQILGQQPFVSDAEPLTPKPIDPFYSPIINKLNDIFNQLGYRDETCKERLVCLMYQNPVKYSPHSNYVSNELSRESSELQKPTQSNPDVIKFYKYVQAARDGQDQRDCNQIYFPCQM